jgi:hypothetical protein
MYLRRELAATVRRALETFPAVVPTGARQTGTTTLLREELREWYGFRLLEDPDLWAIALEDPRVFLAAHPAPRSLDEIQRAPLGNGVEALPWREVGSVCRAILGGGAAGA